MPALNSQMPSPVWRALAGLPVNAYAAPLPPLVNCGNHTTNGRAVPALIKKGAAAKCSIDRELNCNNIP